MNFQTRFLFSLTVLLCISRAACNFNLSPTSPLFQWQLLHSEHLIKGSNFTTLHPCSDNSSCKGDRECKSGDGKPCSESHCVCIPPKFKLCKDSSVCDSSEVCMSLSITPAFCMAGLVSKALLSSKEQIVFPPGKGPVLKCKEGTGNGLSFSSCTASECMAPRQCINLSMAQVASLGSNGGLQCCNSGSCVCKPPVVKGCNGEKDCTDGEVCGKAPFLPAACMTKKVVEDRKWVTLKSPEKPEEEKDETVPKSSEGCIAVDLLRHLNRHELVYKNHRMMKALCDDAGSCATPGHMVLYGGRGMMMSSYCRVVKCVERHMLVNSPAYGRAVRVNTLSKGLVFTAFAARYGTRAEEGLMSAAIRIGL